MAIIDDVRWESNSHEIVHKFPSDNLRLGTQFTLVIGGIILLLNIVIGLIFSSYKPFNIGLNSAVIIVDTLMLYSFGVVQIKGGFKVSLSYLFMITAAIEYILVLFVPKTWKDNAALMTLILLLASQIILYVIAFFV